jgi:hypothetical protein
LATYTAILVGTCARPVEDFDRSPDLVEMIGKKTVGRGLACDRKVGAERPLNAGVAVAATIARNWVVVAQVVPTQSSSCAWIFPAKRSVMPLEAEASQATILKVLEIPAMYGTAFTRPVEIARYCRYAPTQTRGLPDQHRERPEKSWGNQPFAASTVR